MPAGRSCCAACRPTSPPRQPTSWGGSRRIDEDAGAERPGRVHGMLDRPQRGRERLGALAVIPRPVIAPDGVMVRDRAATVQNRIGGSLLDRSPLLQLLA